MAFPRIQTALLALCLAAASAAHAAADYPNRPIRLVSPYSPGGVADPVGRALADSMARDLGQSIVVENKPGGGTMIGVGLIANGEPDGYSAVVVSNAMVNNPFLYTKMPYADEDVRTIGVATVAPLVFIVNPQIPARTLQEFVDYAKTANRPLNYASVGRGNTLHLVTEMLKGETGIEIEEVMYGGKSGEAMMAVMKGEVDMMATVIAHAAPQVQAGTVRALAVTLEDRVGAMPDVPTVAEAGFPNLLAGTWYGLGVHAKTPEPIVERLMTAFDKAITEPAFIERFNGLGLVVQKPRTQDEVKAFVDADRARWKPVIERLQLKLD